MKNIMKRAWEIYRTLTGDRLAKLSQALKMAWAEAKAPHEKVYGGEVATITESNLNKLIAMGATRWTKYNKDRLYLSKAGKNIINLVVEYGKKGHWDRVTVDGEETSNHQAGKIMMMYDHAYIDLTTGKLCDVLEESCNRKYVDMFISRTNAYMTMA